MEDIKDKLVKVGVEGAYGAAAKQASKKLRQAIILGINKKGNSDIAKNTSAFLETEVGDAIVQAILGFGCLYAPLPQVKNNPKAQKFGEKLLEKSAESTINFGVDVTFSFITPVIAEMLSSVPDIQVKELPNKKESNIHFEENDVKNKKE